jgi:hypothetical protein
MVTYLNILCILSAVALDRHVFFFFLSLYVDKSKAVDVLIDAWPNVRIGNFVLRNTKQLRLVDEQIFAFIDHRNNEDQ